MFVLILARVFSAAWRWPTALRDSPLPGDPLFPLSIFLAFVVQNGRK